MKGINIMSATINTWCSLAEDMMDPAAEQSMGICRSRFLDISNGEISNHVLYVRVMVDALEKVEQAVEQIKELLAVKDADARANP